MDQKCDRFYPSAPLEKDILEQRSEKKLNDVNFFDNHISYIKEMITNFAHKNHKSKKNENHKTLNTILESVDSIVFIGATSTSIKLSNIGIGLIVLPISARIACTLSLGNKALHKIIITKHNQNKKQSEKDQKIISFFDNL